jgi:hypothetical protein
VDIWDLQINNRYKLENYIIASAGRLNLGLTTSELLALPEKVFWFVEKYASFWQQNHNYTIISSKLSVKS